MIKAYILINCDKGFDENTVRNLKAIKGIVSADVVYGVYDIVAVVKVPSMEMLEETVVKKIRSVKSVSSTLTMLVAKV